MSWRPRRIFLDYNSGRPFRTPFRKDLAGKRAMKRASQTPNVRRNQLAQLQLDGMRPIPELHTAAGTWSLEHVLLVDTFTAAG